MESKKNRYEREAKKKSLLGEITQDLDTKGDMKNSALETAKDLLVGVVGGGFAGAAIGRASLLVGMVVTGIGHYTKSRLASIFGVGMMASNVLQKTSGVGETENKDMLEGVKERVSAYKDGFLQKLFVDKILPEKKKEEKKPENTSGVGEVQYFAAQETKELEGAEEKPLDLSALEQLERQIAESGNAYVKEQQVKGILSSEIGELDPERNY